VPVFVIFLLVVLLAVAFLVFEVVSVVVFPAVVVAVAASPAKRDRLARPALVSGAARLGGIAVLQRHSSEFWGEERKVQIKTKLKMTTTFMCLRCLILLTADVIAPDPQGRGAMSGTAGD